MPKVQVFSMQIKKLISTKEPDDDEEEEDTVSQVFRSWFDKLNKKDDDNNGKWGFIPL